LALGLGNAGNVASRLIRAVAGFVDQPQVFIAIVKP
jgi:hypothetical protein